MNGSEPVRIGEGQAVLQAFRSSVRLLHWGLIAAGAVYLLSGITFVGPNEEAVVYRLGRLVGARPPGLLAALPPPFDRVVRVPARTTQELGLNLWAPRTGDQSAPRRPGDEQSAHLAAAAAGMRKDVAGFLAPPSRALHPVRDGYTVTADANLVQGRFALRYRIRDAVAWLSQARSGEEILTGLAYRSLTHALAGITVDRALAAGQADVTAAVLREVQAEADRLGLGVELDRLEIRMIAPPQAVVPAFDAVVSAQVEARTVAEQARRYAAEILPKAKAEAYRMRAEADSGAAELGARARGEASAFAALFAEYRLAPAVVHARMAAETRSRVMPRLKYKTILPGETANLRFFLRETP